MKFAELLLLYAPAAPADDNENENEINRPRVTGTIRNYSERKKLYTAIETDQKQLEKQRC